MILEPLLRWLARRQAERTGANRTLRQARARLDRLDRVVQARPAPYRPYRMNAIYDRIDPPRERPTP